MQLGCKAKLILSFHIAKPLKLKRKTGGKDGYFTNWTQRRKKAEKDGKRREKLGYTSYGSPSPY